MPITYRLVNSKGDLLACADSIGFRKGLVADLDADRYTVDVIRCKTGSSGPPANDGASSAILRMGQ